MTCCRPGRRRRRGAADRGRSTGNLVILSSTPRPSSPIWNHFFILQNLPSHLLTQSYQTAHLPPYHIPPSILSNIYLTSHFLLLLLFLLLLFLLLIFLFLLLLLISLLISLLLLLPRSDTWTTVSLASSAPTSHSTPSSYKKGERSSRRMSSSSNISSSMWRRRKRRSPKNAETDSVLN